MLGTPKANPRTKVAPNKPEINGINTLDLKDKPEMVIIFENDDKKYIYQLPMKYIIQSSQRTIFCY